jgi:hypothetical protein
MNAYRWAPGAVVLAVLALSTPAWAYECAIPAPPDQAFASESAVFIGEALNVSDSRNGSTFRQWVFRLASGEESDEVSFKVKRSWKGVTTAQVDVVSPLTGESKSFTVGQEYLVYASKSPVSWSTSGCSRTTLASYATEDLAFLSTIPELPLTSAGPSFGDWIVFGALACVLVAAILVWTLRRRAPPGPGATIRGRLV